MNKSATQVKEEIRKQFKNAGLDYEVDETAAQLLSSIDKSLYTLIQAVQEEYMKRNTYQEALDKQREKLSLSIRTYPIKAMKYKTIGDWENRLNELFRHRYIDALVANTGDDDYNFLIGLHELIEAYLCHKHGILEEQVTEFDTDHPETDNPGELPDAPYRWEHQFAELIERQVARELLIDWEEYDKRVTEVLKEFV